MSKTFEVAFSEDTNKVYITAENITEAIDKFVENNNKKSQRKITADDVLYVAPTNKKSFDEIVKNKKIQSNYKVNFRIQDIPEQLKELKKSYGLETNPYFQRDLCWTIEQKQKYIEHLLRGGLTGRDFYVNFPDWMHSNNTKELKTREVMVLVDGQQRLNAICEFVDDKFTVFDGYFYSDFQHIGMQESMINWHVNDLKDDNEILQWYIDLNETGVAHTKEELERVRKLIKE